MASTSAPSDLGSRILKVNHAGENGAVHIYMAQAFFARWTAPSLVPELLEFKSHEERHRAIFWAELQARGRPRCRSYLLCAMGGLGLGLFTALLGRSAIAATTVAVERVVLKHLSEQIEVLRDTDAQAVCAIRSILDEEQQHHDHSASRVPARSFWSPVLQPLVSASTEAVIWLGMRL